MKKLAIMWVLILTTFLSFADNPSTVKIKTSAICEMCKERIEKRLAFTKGVKDVNLNLDDKVVGKDYPQVDCLTMHQAHLITSWHLFDPKPNLKFKLKKNNFFLLF